MQIKSKRLMTGLLALGLATAGLTAVAAPAQAACGVSGWFCAWYNPGYDYLAVESSTTLNQTVDVADNVVSSAKNYQSRRWCGVQSGSNTILFYFAANTNINALSGSANNSIDYFWPAGTGTC